jgi:hypothetical protein
MPDTEAGKSSGVRPTVPGSQIERSRIASVPAPQNEIIPRTPRAGKIRRRTVAEPAPASTAVKHAPVNAVGAEPVESEAAAKALAEKAAAENAKAASEAKETAARLAVVRTELTTALNQTSAIKRSQRRDRMTAVAAVVVLTALVAFQRLPASGTRVQAARPAPPQHDPLVSEIRLEPERGPVTLARSLDRLNFVIASAGRRPQDVLLAVRASGGADRCPFLWNDGQVSLIYRGGMTMSSVTDALSRCAEAVELLPTDRLR